MLQKLPGAPRDLPAVDALRVAPPGPDTVRALRHGVAVECGGVVFLHEDVQRSAAK